MSEVIIAALGVAFAAFCVWLTVQLVDRRNRWAKRAAIAIVIATALYPLSLGPACWLAGDSETLLSVVPNVHYPILWLARAARPPVNLGRIDQWIEWYSTHCRSDGVWPLLLPGGECVWVVPPDYTEEELENLAEQERSK